MPGFALLTLQIRTALIIALFIRQLFLPLDGLQNKQSRLDLSSVVPVVLQASLLYVKLTL